MVRCYDGDYKGWFRMKIEIKDPIGVLCELSYINGATGDKIEIELEYLNKLSNKIREKLRS